MKKYMIKRIVSILLVISMIFTYCNVSYAKSKKEKLTPKKVSITVGKKTKMKIKNGMIKSCKSKNKKVATVNKKGVVKGKKEGKTTIVVTSKKLKKFKCNVTVRGILNNERLSMKVGDTYKLILKKAKIKDVSVSDSNTISVDKSLKIQAKKCGKSNITITSTNNIKYVCVVKVKKKPQLELDMSFTKRIDEKNVLDGIIENVHGYVSSPENLKEFNFTIKDRVGTVIKNLKLAHKRDWKANKIGFSLYENTIEITALYKDGTSVFRKYDVYCRDKGNFINVEYDKNDDDKDGLINYLEDFYGTSKKLVDSDGDNLTDFEEIDIFGYDPTSKDTDGNGIIDGNEDYDSDGIVNSVEINKYKTNPILKDSDGDNLNDYEEIFEYKTNPLKEDSDNDNASDKWEIDNGFNPNKYNETFDVVTEEEDTTDYSPVAATVELELKGEQVESLEVEKMSLENQVLIDSTIPGYIDRPYTFKVNGDFDEAILTFTYDESLGKLSEDFQPRIYYINEKEAKLELLSNQKVEDGKISAKTKHFSSYILINKVAFDKAYNEYIEKDLKGEMNENQHLNIIFGLDRSGSMDSHNKFNIAKNTIGAFMSKMNDDDMAGICSFSPQEPESPEKLILSYDKAKVLGETFGTTFNGAGSDCGTAMKLALGTYKLLKKEKNNIKVEADYYQNNYPNKHREEFKTDYNCLVLVTDGEITNYTSYNWILDDIKEYKKSNIHIYTVGVESDKAKDYIKSDKEYKYGTELLKFIASETGGEYYEASQVSDIDKAFKQLEEDTIERNKDDNNDGISNYHTKKILEGEFKTTTLSSCYEGIDFGDEDGDFDGDGIKNGDEIEIVDVDSETFFIREYSSPLNEDSDTDNSSDFEELKMGSNPIKSNDCSKEVVDKIITEKYPSEYWGNGYVKRKHPLNELSAGIFFATNDREKYATDALSNFLEANANSQQMKTQKNGNIKVMKGMVEQYFSERVHQIKNQVKDSKKKYDTLKGTSNQLKKIYDYLNDYARANNKTATSKAIIGFKKAFSEDVKALEHYAIRNMSTEVYVNYDLSRKLYAKYSDKLTEFKKKTGYKSACYVVKYTFKIVDMANDYNETFKYYGELYSKQELYCQSLTILEYMKEKRDNRDLDYRDSTNNAVINVLKLMNSTEMEWKDCADVKASDKMMQDAFKDIMQDTAVAAVTYFVPGFGAVYAAYGIASTVFSIAMGDDGENHIKVMTLNDIIKTMRAIINDVSIIKLEAIDIKGYNKKAVYYVIQDLSYEDIFTTCVTTRLVFEGYVQLVEPKTSEPDYLDNIVKKVYEYIDYNNYKLQVTDGAMKFIEKCKKS